MRLVDVLSDIWWLDGLNSVGTVLCFCYCVKYTVNLFKILYGVLVVDDWKKSV